MQKTINKKELSSLLNKSERTLSDWQNQGMPVILADKKGLANQYDLKAVINWLLVKVDLGSHLGSHPGSEQENEQANLEEERTRLTKAQADKAELEVKVLQGKLLYANDVEFIWTDRIVRFRTKMLSLPSKLATILAAESGISVIEEYLRKEISDALDELSKTDDEVDELDKRDLH